MIGEVDVARDEILMIEEMSTIPIGGLSPVIYADRDVKSNDSNLLASTSNFILVCLGLCPSDTETLQVRSRLVIVKQSPFLNKPIKREEPLQRTNEICLNTLRSTFIKEK